MSTSRRSPEQDQNLWERLQASLVPARLQQRATEEHRQHRVRAFWLRQAAVLVFAFRRTGAEELTRAAAALTYNTLIAIVPVMAVAFALFEAFGGLQRFKEPLVDQIVQNIAVGQEELVRHWLTRFIENINAGAIAGFGVIILFYSAVGLLTNIESTFNSIWGARTTRPLHIRLAIYWALLTLSPPLVGLSLSLTSALQSSTVVSVLSDWIPFGLVEGLFSLGSAVAVTIALVLAYVIVPDTKVGMREALAGGMLAGVIWAAVKSLFFWISAGSVKYNAIYGALGLLPLLMIWLYLSWLIVLFGMAYTRAYQTIRHEKLQLERLELSQSKRERLATLLLASVGRRFAASQQAPTGEDLVVSTGAPLDTITPLLEILTRHRLLARSEDDGGRYLPARGLSAIDLAGLVRVLRQQEGLDLELRWDQQSVPLRQALDQAEEASLRELEGWSLHRWLSELPQEREASPEGAPQGAAAKPAAEGSS